MNRHALSAFIGLVWCVFAGVAAATPLDTIGTFCAAFPNQCQKGTESLMAARGTGTNAYYVLEVDPTTGAFPVNVISIAPLLAEDHGYGTVGTSTLRTAAQIGNGTGAADFGTGADSAQTLRTTLSTRAESATSPLATRSGNGSSFDAYDSGASGATVPRVVLSTRAESVATPLAAQLANDAGSAITYNAGAPSAATPRVAAMLGVNGAVVTSLNPVPTDDVSTGGKAYSDSVRNAYASVNVTTGAWVQLIASTAAEISGITLFDSCGQTLELGTGAAASETRKLIIPPGGIDGVVPITIPAGTRVAVRAVSANCTSGELDITGLL